MKKCCPSIARRDRLRMEWARKYMRTDTMLVLFTDESKATLDGPDGQSKGCDEECPKGMRHQHGVGGL